MYSDADVRLLGRRLSKSRIRLDPDEREYAESKLGFTGSGNPEINHAAGMHIMPYEKYVLSAVPENFRASIRKILSEYSIGIYELKDDKWQEVQK
jgi:hypothetical protein